MAKITATYPNPSFKRYHIFSLAYKGAASIDSSSVKLNLAELSYYNKPIVAQIDIITNRVLSVLNNVNSAPSESNRGYCACLVDMLVAQAVPVRKSERAQEVWALTGMYCNEPDYYSYSNILTVHHFDYIAPQYRQLPKG